MQCNTTMIKVSMVAYRVKPNDGCRDGGKNKQPSWEVVGGGEKAEEEITKRLKCGANQVAKHEPFSTLNI